MELLQFNKKPILQEVLKYLAHMPFMFSRGLGENQNFINVNENKAVNHVPEDIINQGLEHGWGICQTELHDKVFKMS